MNVNEQTANVSRNSTGTQDLTFVRNRSQIRSIQRAKTFIWGDEEATKIEINSTRPQHRISDVSYNKEKDVAEVFRLPQLPDEAFPQIKRADLLYASTLVLDAKLGRHSDFINEEYSLKLYALYNHPCLKVILYLCIILNLLLAVFEKPAVKGFELPKWITLSIELLCLIFFLMRFVHMMMFTVRSQFWKYGKNLAIITTILLCTADIIIYITMLNSGPTMAKNAIRWSRPLRPLFLINFPEARQIRRAFRNIRKTLPEVMNVMILYFISIVIFALMALKLFSKRKWTYPDGTPYFNNFLDSFWDLYVLVTTANHPDVILPAYNQSRWYVLFFMGYLIICLYIFMSIFLAVIFNNYKKHLKNEVRHSVMRKRNQLGLAFDVLKANINNKDLLSRKDFNALLKLVPPKRSMALTSLLWFVLDEDMDNYIEKADFLKLADLLNVEVSEVKDRKILFESCCPTLYNCLISVYIRKAVQTSYFRYVFDVLICFNALFIIFDDGANTDWIFLCLFVIEIFLKIYSLGFQHFFNRLWNIFDFVIIGTAVITTVIQKINSSETEGTPTMDALLVLRVLRLVKIIGNMERFRFIVVTIMHICPFVIIYGGVLFSFYYSFGIFGMETFGGMINIPETTNVTSKYCHNALLNGTDFAKNNYCNNNFNDIISAIVVLFELTVVNQWHIITAGFVAVTVPAARLYFLLFHLICVIIVVNIFTAFVLEAFMIEYSVPKDRIESAIEKKIQELGLGLDRDNPETWISYENDESILVKHEEIQGNDDTTDAFDDGLLELPNLSQETGIRFHLRKNIRDVEVLLQRMFDRELQDTNTTAS